MDERNRQKLTGYILRLGAVIIWGIDPIILKYSPMSQVAIEPKITILIVSGTLFSLIILFFTKTKNNYTIPINKYFVFLVISMSLLIFLIIKGLEQTSGTNFILINNFSPILALMIAFVFWRKKIIYLKKKENVVKIFLIFTLGSIGSTLLFYNDIVNNSSENNQGNFIAVIYMVVDVWFIVSQIKYSEKMKDNQSYLVNFYIYFAVLIVFSPLFLSSFEIIVNLPIEQILWTILLGFLWGLGLLLNFEAFRRMDGFIAFLMFNLSILITFSIEAFFLNEVTPTIYLLTAAFFIVSSSIFAEKINTKLERKDN